MGKNKKEKPISKHTFHCYKCDCTFECAIDDYEICGDPELVGPLLQYISFCPICKEKVIDNQWIIVHYDNYPAIEFNKNKYKLSDDEQKYYSFYLS